MGDNRSNSKQDSVFFDPSKELFDNYLSQYKRGIGSSQEASLEKIQKFKLDRIPLWFEYIPREARILDAGCATGYLLQLLHEKGFDRLTGVEFSEEMFSVARARLPEDVALVQSDIREYIADVKEGVFDVVLFQHVLEHIPREFTISLLKGFHRALAPNGCLNIKVPNASFLIPGRHCFGDFTHVVHFSEYSLLQVLETAGFDTKQVEFILHPPRLFWSWGHPVKSILRFFNRIRWLLLKYLSKLLYVICDFHPSPKVFEVEIDVLVRR